MERPGSFEGLTIAFVTVIVMTIRWTLKRAIIKRGVLGMMIRLTVGGNGCGLILGESKRMAVYWAAGTTTDITAGWRNIVAHRKQFAIAGVIFGSSSSFSALEFYEFRGSKQGEGRQISR
jgi:hypothetical protein